eukprot:12595206-Ditylum_brightwellii.AAC.1
MEACLSVVENGWWKPSPTVHILCIQAPLPMAFEAALFSAEMLFPEEVTSFYGELSMEDKERYVQQRWGEDGVSLYKHMQGNDYTVPIGMHKPWWYHSDEVLQKEEMKVKSMIILGDI